MVMSYYSNLEANLLLVYHYVNTLTFYRQKLDNIMPTLPGAEDGVRAARKFLSERLMNPNQFSKKDTTRDLVSSTINQLGILYCHIIHLIKHFPIPLLY